MGPLEPEVRAEAAALAERVKQFDGVEAISEAPRLALAAGAPGVRHFLAWRGSRLAGYAQMEAASPSAELAVHPEARRIGVAAALVGALVSEDPGLRLWAHGDLGPSRRVAAALGLAPLRELWEMTVGRGTPTDAPHQAPPSAPPGRTASFCVRPFEVARDRQAWVELNALAFADHPEQGQLTLADLDRRIARKWFDPAGLLLAEPRPVDDAAPAPPSPALVGYVWTKIEAGVGEIYAIGIHPSEQGKRLGTYLLEVALGHLERQGVAEVRLFVEADNAPAVAAYRRQGFKLTRRDIQYGFARG
ncbi:MAG: mycothiol synthase [Bifidobacteriaceae bacterium]|nr:mycothiol synthase [Bifidobacteriaceae bacterium]